MNTGKKILVVGVAESESSSLAEIVLKGNRKHFPKVAFAKFPDLSGLNTFTELNEKRNKFYQEFEKILDRKGNIVLSGSLTAKTSHGFAPLFTGDFFNKFKPDLTILLEIDPREAVIIKNYGIVKRKGSPGTVKFEQELNRYYSSMLFGAIHIVRVQRGNVKKSLRDLKEVLMSALKS